MSRASKPTSNPIARPKAGVDIVTMGDAALVSVAGLVDEHFAGFGSLGDGMKTVVINVSGMTRMTSFGVRQWLKGMDALLSTVQMPPGVPVACVGLDNARNAAILAAQILGA